MIISTSIMQFGVTSTLSFEVPDQAVWSLLEDGQFLARDSDTASLISEAMSQRIRVSGEVQELLAQAHQLLSGNLHLVACDVLRDQVGDSVSDDCKGENSL